jgi:hypothetical protein
VREWLDAVRGEYGGAADRRRAPLFRRAKPLFALPLVGTGGGGAADRAGQVAQALLPVLQERADELDADIALCLYERAHHAAAQSIRSRLPEYRQAWRDELGDGLFERACELAERASSGGLALFLGAGPSRAAGLPDWKEMLARIAAVPEAGLSAEDRLRFEKLASPLDRASILEQRIGHGPPMGEAIRKALGPMHHYALPHALLAALPVREAVTTNYDTLFETAWADNLAEPPESDGSERLSVLPYGRRSGDRWLLKMHGCASRPDSMVLTRRDYLRYDSTRAALAGVVQGTLINRHVLFVGFSLSDDNFHRIIDSVRRVVEAAGGKGPAKERLGTALMLADSPLLAQLWGPDLTWVAMENGVEPELWDVGKNGPFPWPRLARRQEVFLDCLLAHTHVVPPVLDWRFQGILDEPERRLREALVPFVEGIEPELWEAARGSRAWQLLLDFLREMGYEPGQSLYPP